MKPRHYRARWDEQYVRTRVESAGPRSDDPRFKGFFKPVPQAPYSWLWLGNHGYRLRSVGEAAFLSLVCDLKLQTHPTEPDTLRVSISTREALMWGLGIWGFLGVVLLATLGLGLLLPNTNLEGGTFFLLPVGGGLLAILLGTRFTARRRNFEAQLVEHLGLVPDTPQAAHPRPSAA
jgi:hypothetical protein